MLGLTRPATINVRRLIWRGPCVTERGTLINNEGSGRNWCDRGVKTYGTWVV